MLRIIVCSALAAFAMADKKALPDIMSWEDWLEEFDHPKRWFTALRTDPERRKVFDHNIEKIKKQNALYESGQSGYKFGVNQFADLTAEEFGKVVGLGQPMDKKIKGDRQPTNSTAPAAQIDWRDHGAVTKVKNQGQCGSCWSFSTTGSVEGSVFIGAKQLISVSEKQLVDCSTQNNGCNGGLMDYAFQYIISNGGLDTEADYPYEPSQGVCNRQKEKKHVVTITGYTDVTPNSVSAMKQAIATGPVSIAIEADKEAFQLYNGGVLDSAACGTSLDHGVLAVGYTDDSNSLYKNAFIVKNSWGPTWGVEGYIYISQDTTYSPKGICGILSAASYATGGKVVGPAPGPTPPPVPGSSDYENPFQVDNCRKGEYNVTLPNSGGASICAPECTGGVACPAAPSTFNGVTVGCTLSDPMVNKEFCSLTCNPYGSQSCADGSTCAVFCGTTGCQWLCAYKSFNSPPLKSESMKKPIAVL